MAGRKIPVTDKSQNPSSWNPVKQRSETQYQYEYWMSNTSESVLFTSMGHPVSVLDPKCSSIDTGVPVSILDQFANWVQHLPTQIKGSIG